MARSLLLSMGVVAAAVLILKAFVLVLEPRMAFYPVRGQTLRPRDAGILFQEIAVKTADGQTLEAWFLSHREPRAEVVFWHGNGGNLSLWLPVIAGMHVQGLSVLALDYRGYGKSTGSPTEEGVYRDTEALVHHFWRALHRSPNKVVYWGRSLGATMAAYATTIERPDGLILESGFPDTQSLLNHYPLLKILSVFSTYKFPTADFLRDFSRPVLVLHGERDSIVPMTQGQKLFDRLKTPKQLAVIAGADHNDFHGPTDTTYWRPVNQFIQQIQDR